MVVAQHPAAAGKDLLLKVAGGGMLAKLPKGDGEVAHRAQGVGVVVAEYSAAAGKALFLQDAGGGMLAKLP